MHKLTAPLIALILLLAGCGGHSASYQTVARPALTPSQIAPDCATTGEHTLGQCLPKPKTPVETPGRVGLTPAQTLTGCDLSDNDPVTSLAAWRQIAAHTSWCYLKVSEGTGFTDNTAKEQAALAKQAGVPVGGYDFQHVCVDSPQADAALFVRDARADGLLGSGTLRPMADAEYPSSTNCNVRDWESAWRAETIRLTGENPGTYTGAWWWNPHVGCWWPAPYKGSDVLAWVSGYVSSLGSVVKPCGRATIDVWQFSDHGFNGHGNSDLSSWVAGAKSLSGAIINSKPPPDPYAIYPSDQLALVHSSEHAVVSSWYAQGCRNPVRRKACRTLRADAVLLRGRIFFLAHHGLPPHYRPLAHPRWGAQHFGARLHGLVVLLNHR